MKTPPIRWNLTLGVVADDLRRIVIYDSSRERRRWAVEMLTKALHEKWLRDTDAGQFVEWKFVKRDSDERAAARAAVAAEEKALRAKMKKHGRSRKVKKKRNRKRIDA